MAKKKEDAARKKTEARAALPSTSSRNAAKSKVAPPAVAHSPPNSTVLNPTAPVLPASKDASTAKSEEKKRSKKEINYKEDSGDSTSSVEYPVEGRHTDEESEGTPSEPGNRTPIFPNSLQQNAIPPFMIQPACSHASIRRPP